VKYISNKYIFLLFCIGILFQSSVLALPESIASPTKVEAPPGLIQSFTQKQLEYFEKLSEEQKKKVIAIYNQLKSSLGSKDNSSKQDPNQVCYPSSSNYNQQACQKLSPYQQSQQQFGAGPNSTGSGIPGMGSGAPGGAPSSQSAAGPNMSGNNSNSGNPPPGNQDDPKFKGDPVNGKVQSDGSCVAFGDSLGYGMSKYGPKSLCIHYRPDGSTGDGFIYANGGKSFNNFLTYAEKAMKDPKVKVIDWELGTNYLKGNCAQCGTDYPGKIYEQLAAQAHSNNKIIVLAVYNNTYSQRNDYTAKILAQKYPNNVKLIDYTEIIRRPDGGDNIHYSGNTYAKLGAKRAAFLAKLQETKGS
jgi:hypothetical protein